MIYCSSTSRSVNPAALQNMSQTLPRTSSANFRPLRALLLAGVAAIALSACASNRASVRSPDFSGQSPVEVQATLGELTQRFKKDPRDNATIIYYSAALRAAGQAEQAVAVLEGGMSAHKNDVDIRVAYAKALSAGGRFEQALNVIDGSINPAAPDWNALSVKGAILDQTGHSGEARALYQQALLIAPNEASLYANLGLSYAMTNELPAAEAQLRRAVQMRGATSQIRQNLALVVGLQGRFDECRTLFAAELAPDQVEANMAYIRALLTQQNRWDVIKGEEG
jgi:Flp pilus assembly protein TadD